MISFSDDAATSPFVPRAASSTTNTSIKPPPFPQRLLVNPNERARATGPATSATSSASAASTARSQYNDTSTIRRVRPIAVMPPPGFEYYGNKSETSSSSRSHGLIPGRGITAADVMGSRGSTSTGGSSGHSSSGQRMFDRDRPTDPRLAVKRFTGHAGPVVSSKESSSALRGDRRADYPSFARTRAIAGALAGDWSTNRPLPDLPTFLLTDLISGYLGSSRAAAVQADYREAMSLGDISSIFSANELAAFCRSNNINTNLENKVKQEPRPFGGLVRSESSEEQLPRQIESSVYGAGEGDDIHIPHNLRSTLDSRLLSPPRKVTSVSRIPQHDLASKRRLAPTPLTTDKVFPLRAFDQTDMNVWYRSGDDRQESNARGSQFKPVMEGKEFSKTPRPPRNVEERKKRPPIPLPSQSELLDKINDIISDNRESAKLHDIKKLESDDEGDFTGSSDSFTYFQGAFSHDESGKPVPSESKTEPNTPAVATETLKEGAPSEQKTDTPPLPTLPESSNLPTPAKSPAKSDNDADESSLEHRLAQRQKQIDIGKNTPEYASYRRKVPRDSRDKGHPATPDKFQVISKRNWEGQVKAWRRRLHDWDPSSDEEGEVKDDKSWQTNDEKHWKLQGGLEAYESRMMASMRSRLSELTLKEASAGSTTSTVKPKFAQPTGTMALSKKVVHRDKVDAGK